RLQSQAGRRRDRLHRRGPGERLRAAPVHRRDAQPACPHGALARAQADGGERAGAARRRDPVHGPVPAAGAAPQRRLGQAGRRRAGGARGARGAGARAPEARTGRARAAGEGVSHRRRARRLPAARDTGIAGMSSLAAAPLGALALAVAHLKGPHVDFAALSPLIALLGGATVVLLVGLLGSRRARALGVPRLALLALAAALALTIWQWHDERSIVSGALRIDELSLVLNLVLIAGGACTVLLAWRSPATEEAAHGEWYSLMLASLAGMSMLVAAQNTLAVFLALELLSIPLYVLCASELKREHSLESGLKYLIVGSVGSATLLYGLPMIYGAPGATDFGAISHALSAGGRAGDPLLLTGIALCVAGLCFKASVAPFHQWTPDVYEGAPTPVTAFMAVATKVAALGGFLRFFDVALIGAHDSWGPAVAGVPTITIL